MCKWLFHRVRWLELPCYTAEMFTSHNKFCMEPQQNPMLKEICLPQGATNWAEMFKHIGNFFFFLMDNFPGRLHWIVSNFITGDIFLNAFQWVTGRLLNWLARLIPGRKAGQCAASSSSWRLGCPALGTTAACCLPNAAWHCPQQKALFAIMGSLPSFTYFH